MIRIEANGRLIWSALPRQEEALKRGEVEILYGGARGGGKTATGIIWLLMGNFDETGTVADGGYWRHQNYRALVLRRNASDMGDWLAKAEPIYRQLGAKFVQRPPEFTFPSGATIVVGHLADSDAYEHYQGQEFARILIEELTQIPSEELYLRVMASCRSPFPELRRQLFLTANPGGPGHGWVKGRFVDPVPPGTPFVDKFGISKIYIPARLKDNPYIGEDPQYVAQLMSLPEALRRAWLDGDWQAISGEYFSEFRIQPVEGEPPEAQHVISARDANLEPWFHRWMGADWGYGHDAAALWACQKPNGQIHLYREMVVNRTTPEEFGVGVAQLIWQDIQNGAQKYWQLFLPADALSKKTAERTIGHQMAAGIEQIFGVNSTIVFTSNDDKPDDAEAILRRQADQRSAGVMIVPAPNQRVAGWMFMHSLMRWWPLVGEQSEFDPKLALELFDTDKDRWRSYCKMFAEQETLPRLQIHAEACPRLINAIPKARANDPDRGDPEDVDKRHFPGMDVLDAARYVLFAYKYIKVNEPWEGFFAKHIGKFVGDGWATLSGESKVQIARKAEADYKKLTADAAQAPIYWPRSGGRQRRRGR